MESFNYMRTIFLSLVQVVNIFFHFVLFLSNVFETSQFKCEESVGTANRDMLSACFADR